LYFSLENQGKEKDEGSLMGAAKRISFPTPQCMKVKFLFNSLPFSLLLCISASVHLKASEISRANNNIAR